MAIGTIDIIYTVRLSNGSVVEMTSSQLARYRFTRKYIFPVLRVLFFPVRIFYRIIKRMKHG
jgi:hypothetical protein